MSTKRSNETLEAESAEEEVCEPKAKVSKKQEGPYDLYQFVGEEQPFLFARVETNSEEAKLMREKFVALLEKPDEEQTNFYAIMSNYLSGHDAKDDCYPEVWEEVRKIASKTSSWELLSKKEWAPLKFSMSIANFYILNTWC